MRFGCQILALAVALLVVPLSGQAQETPPDGHTIDGLLHPESVARGTAGEAFYAANIGKKLAPSAKDGDGFIARLAADGTIETLRYLPATASNATLHAPKGTVVLDGRLYTADIDRVVGFDLDERTKIDEVSLEAKGVSFLNDLAVLDAQTLLVSGSDQGKIYRVDLETGTAARLEVDVPGVNGLTYVADENTLYAVTFGGEPGGQLWSITLNDAGAVVDASSRTIVENGRFDSVVHRPNGQILVSDWGVEGSDDSTPALHRIGEAGSGAVTTIELADWQGPADFVCDATHGCWIPDLPASTVYVVRPGERTGQ